MKYEREGHRSSFLLSYVIMIAVARNLTGLSRTNRPLRVRYALGDRKGRPYVYSGIVRSDRTLRQPTQREGH